MKKLSKILFVAGLITISLLACKKDENQIFYSGGTAPVLSASKANNSTLSVTFAEKDNELFKLIWTNPNYQMSTGLSSQDVNYTIEIDTTGANFTNPKRKVISVSKDLMRSFTVGEFNDMLLNQLELNTTMNHNIEVRVKSNLVNNTALPQLISNTMKFVVKPYALPPKVDLPTSGELYMVGNATPGGWSNPVPTPSQKFTQISPTQYEITIAITGGNSYLFLPVNGSWADKYGFDGANNANVEAGDNLKRGGGDMKAPAASGNYKIVVNFQTGKFSLTKL